MPLMSLAEARAERKKLRAAGRRLVFTNGHFELLHLGHLRYLEAASALGDALFVGVNGDGSTRRLKGRGGSLVPADERATLVAALRPVTAAIIFEEETARSLIEALQPEIYVKGGDYSASAMGRPAKPLPERAAVEVYGGCVILVDYLAAHSTTQLLTRITALSQRREQQEFCDSD